MRDFNFFRSYQRQVIKKTDSQQYFIAALLASVFVVLSVYGFFAYKMYVLNKDMEEMNAFMTNNENLKQYKKFSDTKNKLALLTVYYDLASKLNLMIENDAVLNTVVLERFEKAMPTNTSLKSLKINDDNLTLEGVTDSREVVAEFQNNLIETGDYKDVFVTNINHAVNTTTGEISTNYYVFSITCELKEGIDR